MSLVVPRMVIDQTLVVAEIVVVDDGSNDGTLDVARSFGARVRVEHQPRLGAMAAANMGATSCTALWLAFARPGTRWHPDRVARLFDQVGPLVSTARVAQFDESVADPRDWWTLMVRRDVFARAGGFAADVLVDEDPFFVKRLEVAGVRVVGPPSPTVTA